MIPKTLVWLVFLFVLLMSFILLLQKSPFAGEDEEDLFDSICRDKVHYPKWISSAAEDCLSQVGTIHA